VPPSCRFAAQIIAVSEFSKRDLITRLGVPEEKIAVAPNAVDPELARLLLHAPRRSGEVFTVLAVGNVLPRKNLFVLAAAVRACIERGTAMQLRLVGSIAPEGRSTAHRISQLLGPSVSFSGYLPLAGLAAEYRSADVLCFPSLFEGFGLPVIEAMAAGTPVVVSDAASLPEVAGDAAWICAARDVRSWRDALLQLQRDPEARKSLARRGTVRARQYSWSESAQVVLEALRYAGANRGNQARNRGEARDHDARPARS
jgi:glycosyltransferase involved in cell wall biosynthesis